MIAVPITHYLERKSRESAGISSEPTPLDIQAATEAWYAKGFKEGSAQAKSACDAALAHREVECKLWIDAARKLVGDRGRGARNANHARSVGC